jgi:hypothetical protein
VTEDSIADASRGLNAVLAAWRSFDLGGRAVMARLRSTSCDECARPIRWWNRRVWATNRERCTHLQCWNGQQFIKSYVQLMSEEIRHSAQARKQLSDNNDSVDAALRELRAYARALRERVERLEAQLQQAEEVAAKMRVNAARKNGKLSTPSSRIRHS